MADTGLHYDAKFLGAADRAEIVAWLARIQPLWENRFTARAAAAAGGQRRLLRPVYWLGAWQFACLDYYRPPHVRDRCVAAEPYPPVLARLVAEIERRARRLYRGRDLPDGWCLNTCLVNLYGSRIDPDGRRSDCARLGEHRDFEPGPVASLSLGERALFQFVRRGKAHEATRVLAQEWLEDGSLQLFGGEAWKKHALHRVLRVEKRGGFRFDVRVADFETRRVNFTFRWVPREHIAAFAALGEPAKGDVRGYVAELASASEFFARQLAGA